MEPGQAEISPYVVARSDWRRKDRAILRPILKGLSEGGCELRNVSEENGGVERETADWLERDLDGVLR